jgi:signal peptidase I
MGRGAMEDTGKATILNEVWQWTGAILLAVIITFVIRGFIFEPVYVQGESMENTLSTSQRLLVYKLGYYFNPPSRGDIIVLQYQEGFTSRIPLIKDLNIIRKAVTSLSEVDYIKRVIAVPGDELEIKNDGNVYLNGKKLDEPYIKETCSTYSSSGELHMIIPEGYVFAMGDNRQHSKDSRQIGLIGFERIKGKAVFRAWPAAEFGRIY